MKPLQPGSFASFPWALVSAVIAGMIGLNLIGPTMTGTIMTGTTGIGRAAEPAPAPNPDDITPPWGTFPKAGAGIDLAGELIAVDHVNRRFALRLDGDFNQDRYGTDSRLRAILLPYGEVWYHGAPADLGDLPLGTRLHGRFLLPPKDAPPRELTREETKYPPPMHDRALVVEDDFSHASRRSRAFRIDAVDIKRIQYGYDKAIFAHDRGTIALTQVRATGQPLDGPSDTPADATYTLDASTRVWKDGRQGRLTDLSRGQIVQVNLGWAPEWANRQFHCLDIWIDEKSRTVATDRQLQTHIRRKLHYWIPGWIDRVDYRPDGAGVITVTYFSGMDQQLYAELNIKDPFRHIYVVDEVQRAFRGGRPGGHVTNWEADPTPPPGSSGITHEIQVSRDSHLEGFRPGSFVRVGLGKWPQVPLPPEILRHFHLPGESQNPLD